MEEFLTVDDVCKILKIGKNQGYKLVEQPDFPKIQIGKLYRIPKSKFEKYLTNNTYKQIYL